MKLSPSSSDVTYVQEAALSVQTKNRMWACGLNERQASVSLIQMINLDITISLYILQQPIFNTLRLVTGPNLSLLSVV